VSGRNERSGLLAKESSVPVATYLQKLKRDSLKLTTRTLLSKVTSQLGSGNLDKPYHIRSPRAVGLPGYGIKQFTHGRASRRLVPGALFGPGTCQRGGSREYSIATCGEASLPPPDRKTRATCGACRNDTGITSQQVQLCWGTSISTASIRYGAILFILALHGRLRLTVH
jgi:hypothetical protein